MSKSSPEDVHHLKCCCGGHIWADLRFVDLRKWADEQRQFLHDHRGCYPRAAVAQLDPGHTGRW